MRWCTRPARPTIRSDVPGHQSLLARIPATGTTLAVLVADDDVPMSAVVEPLLPYLR